MQSCSVDVAPDDLGARHLHHHLLAGYYFQCTRQRVVMAHRAIWHKVLAPQHPEGGNCCVAAQVHFGTRGEVAHCEVGSTILPYKCRLAVAQFGCNLHHQFVTRKILASQQHHPCSVSSKRRGTKRVNNVKSHFVASFISMPTKLHISL